MSAPYWGQLPGPKVVKTTRVPDQVASAQPAEKLYPPMDTQAPRQANRVSVQTAQTDDSTFSPYSPNRSSFSPKGLGPRPPSYQRGHARGQSGDFSSRNARRISLPPEQYYYDEDAEPPPAAPEVPRAPPLSYRQPYGNGGMPYQNGPPSRLVASNLSGPDDLAAEEYYRPRQSNGNGHAASSRAVSDSYTPRRGSEAMASDGMAPISGSSDRRKKFADDRSPLQRLELTLDSMTKEEKRARVLAAEQRAREKAAKRAMVDQEPTPDMRSHARRASASDAPSRGPALAPAPVMTEPSMPREPPIQKRNSSRRAAPASQPPLNDSHTYASGALPAPEAPSLEDTRHEDVSGLPKRNLSFRERAVQDDVGAGENDANFGVNKGSGGDLSVTRSDSNKLRKHPPGDPWYHRRMEAERRMPSVSRRGEPISTAPAPQQPQPTTRAYRDKDLPPDPPAGETRAPTGVSRIPLPVAVADRGFDGIQRRATEPVHARDEAWNNGHAQPPTRGKVLTREDASSPEEPAGVVAARRRLERQDSFSDDEPPRASSTRDFGDPEHMEPGFGLYQPPKFLEEWKKATVGTLSGSLLDIDEDSLSTPDKSKAWWEAGGHRRGKSASTRRRAEAFDGEYDDTAGPTRFKPQLNLRCGPLLRYCGVRHERIPMRTDEGEVTTERELWRGTVMIVTKDSDSSYEIAPTLRLFVQDLELLPPPPHHINGELPPEYVDPLAGHPKLGRKGETLYVRPVEHLEEAKDLSQLENDAGLFESTRSPADTIPGDKASELAGSYSSRRKRIKTDGEKAQRYKDVRGFRLHAERGCTFWRFNVEVELRERQQRIAYRINRGPSMGFWVPARGHSMNVMFYSCNGFSSSVKPNDFSGPDPMWRDVLNNHQSQPFHVMLGGGDQIYNDCAAEQCTLFDRWLDIPDIHEKDNAPFTSEMQNELEDFYLNRYCQWFSQGLFGLATSQIPMVNMYDDHDIFDGYGSYSDRDMQSPVFRGIGAVAFKYYLLFQHQSVADETEKSEPSWILGTKPGPYIEELSRSVFLSLGGKVALLALDCRTERTEHDIIQDKTWEKTMDRMYAELRHGQVEHLLVLLGVPIAYPRLNALENVLSSRLMDPIKALGKTGAFAKMLNGINGGPEILDDLNDHWTAKNHKFERSLVVEDLQDLAIDKSMRITILSGDVHLAAIGQFFSNPKLGLPKHKDPRYMLNVISSAIVNAPPPDLMADVLNRRNKTHHFDKKTEEDMVPLFQYGVDGKPRNNKRLLPHRNWCSIRQWTPGTTPPPTPPASDGDRSPSPPPKRTGSFLRRLSLSRKREPTTGANMSRDSVRGPRPPISGGGNGGGLFRSLSRRMSGDGERPAKLTRSQSVDRGENNGGIGRFFGLSRSGSRRRPDDGGINGQWGVDSEDDEFYDAEPQPNHPYQPSGLRGGGTYDEFSEGDDSYFTARPPRRAQTVDSTPPAPHAASDPDFRPRAFHRTPTGLSVKQMKQASRYEVDLEGGLDICLNVEVNPRDPTGITVPYRLLVPKLFYEFSPTVDGVPPAAQEKSGGGFKRFLSFKRKGNGGNSYITPPTDSAHEGQY